tara:strand:+ start:568 stop:711 length:144 start_codon:yes stop_codon:yes gene_type:complete
MRVHKPAIASADISLLKKVIAYYLNKHPEPEEQKTLINLFHRLGRLE